MSASDWPIEIDPVLGCWVWQGSHDNSDGRAIVWRGRHAVKAHLVVYEQIVGPVPDGLVLDHTCSRATKSVGACVAPHHLEPVSHRENSFRKSFRYRARIERCKAGHDLRLTSIVIAATGGRVCRTCNREAMTHFSSPAPG